MPVRQALSSNANFNEPRLAMELAKGNAWLNRGDAAAHEISLLTLITFYGFLSIDIMPTINCIKPLSMDTPIYLLNGVVYKIFMIYVILAS